jgi:hypothetical protein
LGFAAPVIGGRGDEVLRDDALRGDAPDEQATVVAPISTAIKNLMILSPLHRFIARHAVAPAIAWRPQRTSGKGRRTRRTALNADYDGWFDGRQWTSHVHRAVERQAIIGPLLILAGIVAGCSFSSPTRASTCPWRQHRRRSSATREYRALRLGASSRARMGVRR